MLLMVFAIIMSIINLKLYYICTSLHMSMFVNTNSWFPHRLENLEKWENCFQSGKSQGILNRLEKSGNFTQNTGKGAFLASFYFYFFSQTL